MAYSIKLNTGFSMPIIGLGTWLSQPGEVGKAVKVALEAGYRLLDCATIYMNEAEIGDALKCCIDKGLVEREDVFITTKLWNTDHQSHCVRKGLETSLEKLQLKYIDLYLIHWPFAFKEGDNLLPKDEEDNFAYDSSVTHLDTWRELEKCVDAGLVRSLGISNFNSKQIKNIIDHARIKPAVLQTEIHPFLQQEKLVDFCHQNGLTVTSYSSFGNPGRVQPKEGELSVLDNPTISEIAKSKDRKSAQVILRWLVQRNICVIPKSVTPSRIGENFKIFDFLLDKGEMEKIAKLDIGMRMMLPMAMKNGVEVNLFRTAPNYPFDEEF